MSLLTPRALKLSLLTLVLSITAVSQAAGISASATMTDVQVSPGLYDYSITLNNTGTTTIGTFWFGWIPGAGFLTATPSDVESPAGWADKLTNGGKAIQWTTTTNPLDSGWWLSGFSFESNETPAEMLLPYAGAGTGHGDLETTSFVYSGAPFADPGEQFVVTETPEPNTLLLSLTGLGLLIVTFRQRIFRKATSV